MPLSKIVATVGPATESPEFVARLIEAGVSVFRLNFSHGTLAEHERRLASVRAAADAADMPIAVLGDLPGPKIRLGRLPASGIEVAAGEDVVLLPTEECEGRRDAAAAVLPTTCAWLGRDVHEGQRVLINDGAIRLLALGTEPGGALRCRVVVGGTLTSSKGINFPDTEVSAPPLAERDWECVSWAVRHGVDFLAMSFVRAADEVAQLKSALEGMCSVERSVAEGGKRASIPVIAKIEKPQAVRNIDAILAVCDGIMVARGDLGVEIDLAHVPMVQKRLIAKADQHGKPCIVATQMLESMIENASPTRAEVSDVANAVLDGADAVMLSAETAVGRYPLQAVAMMRRVIEAAESDRAVESAHASPPRRAARAEARLMALAHGAWQVARDLHATMVICWSETGATARALSQMGYAAPIVAYSSSQRETRRMALFRGVRPLHWRGEMPVHVGAFNAQADADLLRRGWVKRGDTVVVVAGPGLGTPGRTTALAVHLVGDATTGFMP
ncbi:MAG: pyruvate kinase [Phycisphaerae bacterium]|nr:pyruvate kinase [Phycisphaerae bacterium]